MITYGIKDELSDVERHRLSSEVHNLHHLKMVLLNHKRLSAEDLAVLAFLVSEQLMQMEELEEYFKMYMEKLNDICQLLNPGICGEIYSYIVKRMYQQCKCDTPEKYLHNFLLSPCMEYFPCEVVNHIESLGVLQLSDVENAFIHRVVQYHCKFHYEIKLRMYIIVTAGINYFAKSGQKIFTVLMCLLLANIHLYDVVSTHLYMFGAALPTFEVTSKAVCHITVWSLLSITLYFVFKIVAACIVGLKLLAVGWLFMVYLICIMYFSYYPINVGLYCCQFIPICL